MLHGVSTLMFLCIEQGHVNVMHALQAAQSAEMKKQFDLIGRISNDVCSNKGVLATRVLGF